jgi:hypothetical protein
MLAVFQFLHLTALRDWVFFPGHIKQQNRQTKTKEKGNRGEGQV